MSLIVHIIHFFDILIEKCFLVEILAKYFVYRLIGFFRNHSEVFCSISPFIDFFHEVSFTTASMCQNYLVQNTKVAKQRKFINVYLCHKFYNKMFK